MRSTQQQTANALLEQFGNRFGLAQCSLDSQGTALLAFDDVFVDILLDEERSELLLLAEVGCPEASAEIYGWLLDANLFGHLSDSGARGTTLARDPTGHSIILQRSLPIAGLEVEGFETALEHFVGTAERVRRRLVLNEPAATADPVEQRPAQRLIEHFLRA